MSGLSRTPGKRVWVNSPPRVRIPPSPPTLKTLARFGLQGFFRWAQALLELPFGGLFAGLLGEPRVNAATQGCLTWRSTVMA